MSTNNQRPQVNQIFSIFRVTSFNIGLFAESPNWSDYVIDEEDSRSLAITTFNSAEIKLVGMFKKDELKLSVEEKLKRQRNAGYILLDACVFQFLWKYQSFIPKSWKKKVNGMCCYIYFGGTIIRNLYNNRRYTMCFYWDGEMWIWRMAHLNYSYGPAFKSAVLER